MESSCDVGGPKYPWPVVNRKMKSSRVGLTPRCHCMIEFGDYLRIKELTRNHERLQMVSLHEEHRVLEPRVYGKCWEIVVNLPMEISPPTVNIPRDGVVKEVGLLDNGCNG